MKLLSIGFLLIVTVVGHGQEKWTGGYETNKVIYAATVNGKRIEVLLSEGPFDPDKHKVDPFRIEERDGKDIAIWPKVNGYAMVGLDGGPLPPKASQLPHLQRLAVSFGDKTIECPSDLLAHVFLPWTDTTFKPSFRNTLVTISSDSTTVIIDLACGDGGGVGNQMFTIALDGKCLVGQPEAPMP
ncbi:hypothetical protein [Roseibacillus persicicus]|uniref:Uncharacterized protein n=1 Tax=Roseibacillus persicicus TaxID=454148 RepID=A0A918TYE2_9BACT|nr:hypothetical protein [Roseibacillus persicicus]GHC68427.1 hypothetical protein GCM10007100_40450 [Roseibacillus persicicus]